MGKECAADSCPDKDTTCCASANAIKCCKKDYTCDMGDCWAPEPTCKNSKCPEGKTCCEGYSTSYKGHVDCCDSEKPVCTPAGECIPTPPPCSHGQPGDCDTVGK